ncbi:hypothetical protein BH09PSE4_BH09PSE4_15910 [soil metagenome]
MLDCGVYFVAVLWPPVAAWFDEISEEIARRHRLVATCNMKLGDGFAA